jgi:AAA15 family ATPase/GTPase
MFESLYIENFKRFRKLRLSELKRVNLIAGKNNTGKTGILEAIFLLLNLEEISNFPELFRKGAAGDLMENFWKWQFHNRDTSKPFKVSASSRRHGKVNLHFGSIEKEDGFTFRSRMGQISFGVQHLLPNGNPGTYPIPGLQAAAISIQQRRPEEDAQFFDRVVLQQGGEERLEQLARQIEPRLKSIRSIKPYGASLLYIDLGLPEKIPATHLGQGFLRLLSIYSQLIAGGHKIVLIDEIENGLHHSILKQIWTGLLGLAEREDVQIFATTHSYECIQAAHSAFAETLDYDFALHRLDEVNGQIEVVSYDKDVLETSLQTAFEVR